MTTIHIAASREYDVVIEPGLLTRLGTMAAELGLGRRAAVISDDAVFALYGAAAEKAQTPDFKWIISCSRTGNSRKIFPPTDRF